MSCIQRDIANKGRQKLYRSTCRLRPIKIKNNLRMASITLNSLTIPDIIFSATRVDSRDLQTHNISI